MDAIEIKVPNAIFLPKVIDYLKDGHTVTLPLNGYSMRPFLENGRDKALLSYAADKDKLKVGDPVLAEVRKGFFVLHRLVAINGNEVTLLGDGNLTPEHCHRDDIRATVIGFYRKGRQTLDRTDGRKWRWYSWWWMLLRPIRRYLLFIYRHLFV